MNCLICNTDMMFFFSKQFNCYGLDQVDYWKCSDCGFTISKTHAELVDESWQNLNSQYHSSYQGRDICPDDPRWLDRIATQADVIGDLVSIGILNRKSRWLDYACGDGKLSSLLKNQYNLNLMNYDRYMATGAGYLKGNDLRKAFFDFVITTSVFEHFVKREDFDFVNSLVCADGVLGLHTVVCESIPRDPSWFYFLPVHSSFFTNKSMETLFQQWGYQSSIYNVEARLWFFFKNKVENIQTIIGRANKRHNLPKYIFKEGFVDYWK